MEFGKVLKRAWEITWKWKILWILGFLASLGSGGGGGGSSSSVRTGDGIDLGQWGADFPEVWAAIGGVVLGLMCLGFVLIIAIWVVSTIARGGLIAGVQQVEDEGSTGFRQAWRVGASKFWTLFGISILSAIPVLILAAILTLGVVAGAFGSAGLFDVSEAAGGIGVAGTVLCGLSLCCLLFPVIIVLDQIRIYAERAAVLEGLGWIDAFKRGWEVLKDNLGPTIILWIIFFLIGIAFAAVVVGGVLGLMAPLGIALGVTNGDPTPWILVPTFCGGFVALILLSLIGSVVETFTSATWTLAYRELTGLGGPGLAVEEGPVDEPDADVVLIDTSPDDEAVIEDLVYDWPEADDPPGDEPGFDDLVIED